MLWVAGLCALCGVLRAGADAQRYEIVAPADAALQQAGRGDWDGARAALRQALDQDDSDAEAWSALALIQGHLGDVAGARRSRKRVARLADPSQQRAVLQRQQRMLEGRHAANMAAQDPARADGLDPDGDPGFTISTKAPRDPEPVKRPTKWDHHGWPTPTPQPTPTPLRLPAIVAPGKQEPRVHPPRR
jgi:tetratricopeptide (TPR) repeat protein